MPSAIETLIRKSVTPAIMKVAEFNRGRMPKPKIKHVFLDGVNAPVKDEVTDTNLQVTGAIPTELEGRYIRIGPNPITPPNEASHHWFLGDGMVHGVSLKAGKALWYRNRYIRSNAVSDAMGEPRAPGERNPFSDTVNTNVLGHAGETWALVEAGGFPVRIDAELNTIAHDNFGGTLKNSFSAHPHLDPLTGEMHAICYKGTDQNTIHHVVVDAAGKVRREEPIHVQDGPMIHDCIITKNFVIILDLPVTFSMKTLLSGHGFPYRWNPVHKARVGLLPREGTSDDVIWCDVAPCAVFHPCNAYENEDGSITMDICAHDRMFDDSTSGPDSTQTPFERWSINPSTKTVDRTVIDADAQEFPRCNEALLGQPYRYAYTMALPDGFDSAYPDNSRIFKHDLVAGTRQVHDFGKGRVPGEFVFVPKASDVKKDAKEDSGWMMGYVVNVAGNSADLVIIDAENFSGAPQALIHIPHRIPAGFHGNWVGV
jgi:8'-apo-carotenoid 13,14-cleaving dioxygenase